MERYFIYKTSCEVKCPRTSRIKMADVLKEGITFEDTDPVMVNEYTSLESAREALKDYKSDAWYGGRWAVPFFVVEEYHVEVETGEYDEYGDWVIDQGEIDEISENDFQHDAEAWDGKEEEDEEC